MLLTVPLHLWLHTWDLAETRRRCCSFADDPQEWGFLEPMPIKKKTKYLHCLIQPQLQCICGQIFLEESNQNLWNSQKKKKKRKAPNSSIKSSIKDHEEPDRVGLLTEDPRVRALLSLILLTGPHTASSPALRHQVPRPQSFHLQFCHIPGEQPPRAKPSPVRTELKNFHSEL